MSTFTPDDNNPAFTITAAPLTLTQHAANLTSSVHAIIESGARVLATRDVHRNLATAHTSAMIATESMAILARHSRVIITNESHGLQLDEVIKATAESLARLLAAKAALNVAEELESRA